MSCILTFFSWLKHLDWTFIFAAIAAAAAVAGVVIALWPKSAHPDIGQLRLYVSGTVGQFWFLCEFDAKNDGLGACTVEHVEILIDECNVTPGGSVEFTSGRRTTAETIPRFFCTALPESIGKYSKENIVVVGTAASQVSGDIPGGAEVKVTFQTRRKPIVMSKRTHVITRGSMQNYYPDPQ